MVSEQNNDDAVLRGNHQLNQPYQCEGAVRLQNETFQHNTDNQINTSQLPYQGTVQNMNANPTIVLNPTGNSTEEQVFPVKTFQRLGGFQIGLGVLLCILSVIGTIVDGIEMTNEKRCSYDQYSYNGGYCKNSSWGTFLLAYDISCLVLSFWFFVPGILPMCMTTKRRSSWRCMKIAFMVCSIIGASLFVPPIFYLGLNGSFLRSYYLSDTLLISVFITILSFAEAVVSILSASYCCCCTKWHISSQFQQGFVYIGGNSPQLIMTPQSQIQGGSSQPVVMTTTQQQYAVGQQQHFNNTINQGYSDNTRLDSSAYKL